MKSNQRYQTGIWIAVSAIALLAIGACSRKNDATHAGGATAVAAKPDPAWANLISAHTIGAVSRTSSIRVVFTNDVVAPDRVGADASAYLSVTPRIADKPVFVSTREIVLVPTKSMPASTRYLAKVTGTNLKGVPEKLAPFEFVFQTLAPNFEVIVDGLATGATRSSMQLTGAIATADIEDSAAIEKVLRATFAGKPATIAWNHAPESRRHAFTIANLERQSASTKLSLNWNGKPIAVANAGTQEIEVPGRAEFVVIQAQALEEATRRSVIVQFSDALDAKQNVKGLVTLTNTEFTTRIDGNTLTLYPQSEVSGDMTLAVEPGIQNAFGDKLATRGEYVLTFMSTKPQVRFVGTGVILPEATTLSVPFEAVSVRAVQVTALRVYERNVPQFLQVNRLDGTMELGRVGRYLWRKTIPLTAPVAGRWTRYHLDVTELVKANPGGLFQLTLSIAPQDATYACENQSANTSASNATAELANQEDGDMVEDSNWDYAEEYFGADAEVDWTQRNDPCAPAYYRYADGIRSSRNLLASNVGLIAKRDARGGWLVAVTNLRTAEPLGNAKVTATNFQGDTLGSASTDATGIAELRMKGQPFTLIAEASGSKGYLKVNAGASLPVSHFDVGGETLASGLKGHLYGDRGVWRPGDPIYLTFVVQDKAETLPANHPVTLELRNPRGQVTQVLTNNAPTGNFYTFALRTADDAPTGDWIARATLGGATFTKALKVETVMPNRLKIDLAFADEQIAAGKPLRGKLAAQWLSGASAAGLKADVQMRLTPTPTRFTRAADYVFDDPTRSYSSEPVTVFDGTLDANGSAAIATELQLPKEAPGMLNASFSTRVFERGGAFSINRESRPLAPFTAFVGLKLPKGDASRDMLLTDQDHTVELATLDADGKPISLDDIAVSLQKIEWRWWWDQTSDSSLAQYSQSESHMLVSSGTARTQDGKGSWKFRIKYPEWGRYLVRACDTRGGHCTGRVFYIDWPGWAGRAQDQSGPAASILTLTSDKESYKVGESAIVQLPVATVGRALLTLETGSAILEHRWIEPREGTNRVTIPITSKMAPNVYVSVTMIQPHANRANDRPIRLYGVVPLKVTDPATKLAPTLTTANEWAPQSKAKIQVAEQSGRAMTYTLAVVDEGLLGLTNFKTPSLHAEFYKREALGIATWDLFDEVVGAYGADLERLLALGGSDGAAAIDPDANKSRFPPVVRFMGPFQLKAGEKRAHEVDLPQYVGAVRVMLVAGDRTAYGSAEKSVFVRQPLMVLPTLPRVIGPEETFSLPVSVFVADPFIKNVSLRVEADSRFSIVGSDTTTLAFARPEERLGTLKLRSGTALGRGKIRVVATSGKHSAVSDIYLEVRSPNPMTTVVQRAAVEPGATWREALKWHGIAGTNSAVLEVSAIPPLNLDGRLEYLIRYPHGCLEQTTSAAFPQLYLPVLTTLPPNKRADVQRNIGAAVERLRSFQRPNGGFTYWPGGWATGEDLAWREDWSTSYAGHFLVEADKLGYRVPADVLSSWVNYQKTTAQRWNSAQANALAERSAALAEASRLAQAYRLYTLAIAGKADVGSMNRLRESRSLSAVERWLLAASYKIAGLQDAASTLMKSERVAYTPSAGSDYTFGSDLRDRALLLHALVALGRQQDAAALVDDISAALVSSDWYSTQSVAYSLMAMAKYAGGKPFEAFSYERDTGGRSQRVTSQAIISSETLESGNAGAPLRFANTSDRKLYATVVVRGVPPSGVEDAAQSGLSLALNYLDAEGNPLSVSAVPQGADLITRVVVTNTSKRRVDNLALTQIVPAGWEIRNERLEGADSLGARDPNTSPRGFAWDGSPEATRARPEYVDIRDDRILQYFSLKAGESITFATRMNAAYLGRFYLPSTSVEAMYDAKQFARSKGQWVEVVAAEGRQK